METPGKSVCWLRSSDFQPFAEMFTTQRYREEGVGVGGGRVCGGFISQCPPLMTSLKMHPVSVWVPKVTNRGSGEI